MSRVAIIGFGFGGLAAAAVRLKQAGIEDLVLFEKSDDVGGCGGRTPIPAPPATSPPTCTRCRSHRRPTSGGAVCEADVLIAATGQLSRPSMPDVPGLDRFEGTLFHSARWDHDHDLTGKRVAVLGTGAIQFVPAIAGGCRSWYLTESGHNTQNWPASTLTFRRRLRWFRIEDFEPAPVSGGTRT